MCSTVVEVNNRFALEKRILDRPMKEMEGRLDDRRLEGEEREEEWRELHTELQGRRRAVEVERRLREEVQVHLEEARVEVRRLAEELAGRSRGGGGEERGVEDSSLLHSTWASMVHDTSVDDRLLEGGAPVPHLLLRSPPRSSPPLFPRRATSGSKLGTLWKKMNSNPLKSDSSQFRGNCQKKFRNLFEHHLHYQSLLKRFSNSYET